MLAHTARFLAALLLLSVLLLASACEGRSQDKQAIEENFRQYRAAALDRRGAAAVELVSQGSHEAIEQSVKRALSTPADALKAMPIADRFEVLLFRHLTAGDRETIRKLGRLKGREVLKFMIDSGWSLDDQMAQVRLGSIRLRKTSADADLVYDGRREAVPVYFVLEDGKWLRDMTQNNAFNKVFASLAAKHQVPENDLMLIMLEYWTGRAPDEDFVWAPMAPNSDRANPLAN